MCETGWEVVETQPASIQTQGNTNRGDGVALKGKREPGSAEL